jgi:hypothetical protein
MPFQSLSAALVRVTQVSPSVLVMTRFPVPESDTAAKRLSVDAHAMASQPLFAALARVTQVVPAADRVTVVVLPSPARRSPNTVSVLPGSVVPIPMFPLTISEFAGAFVFAYVDPIAIPPVVVSLLLYNWVLDAKYMGMSDMLPV